MAACSPALAIGRRTARLKVLDNHVSEFDVEYFLRLVRGERKQHRTRKLYLKSLKSLHLLLSNHDSALAESERMIRNGCNNYRYLHSLPRPRFPLKVSFQSARETDDNVNAATIEQQRNCVLVKRMCGISFLPLHLMRASISARCMDTYPVELRYILYKFIMTHIHDMDTEDLFQMDQLLKLGLDDRNNSILLGYLSAKIPVDPELFTYNKVLRNLLSFMSTNHPSLLSMCYKT